MKVMDKKKRARKDAFLDGVTYLSSGLSVLVLAALFIFIFMKGGSLLNFDLLKNDYWSNNYLVAPAQATSSTTFQKPDDLSEEAYFSEKWGVAFVDHINQNKERLILIEYIDDASPLKAMVDISIKDKPVDFTSTAGLQVEKIQYKTSSNMVGYAGSIMSNKAKDVAEILDRDALSIDSVYYKTPGGGIRGSIMTTLMLMLVSLAIALPIGIGSAIYLNEYAKKSKFNALLRSAVETLTGVPSIVFGLMGITVLFPITQAFGATTTNILLGSFTMAIILLPTIIRSTEEALLVVPQHLRDASLSVGANQSQTIFKIVLPCAVPGMLTGVLLSIGRIIGESAALIYTMGTFISDSPSLTTSGTSLAVHIWSLMSGEQPNFELASAISIIILIFVLILNISVKLISKRFSKAWY